MRALKTFAVALLLTAAILGGGFFYLNFMVSQGLDGLLRKHVFTDPKRAGFEKAGIQAWRGKAYLRGLRLDSPGAQGAWKGTVSEISLTVPVRKMFSGSLVFSSLRVDKPAFEALPGAESAEVNASSAPEAGAAPGAGPIPAHLLVALFKKFPIEELEIADGSLRLASPSGGSPLAWEKVRIAAKRSGDSDGAALKAEGRMAGQKSGFSLEAKLSDLYAPCASTEGQVRIDQLPVPALAAYFPPDPGMKFLDGSISLNTQFTCKKDWLTASHLVEIKNFSVDVSEDKKKILGVSVKYLKDLFRIEQLSFVIPMNGAVADPHIGISSSLQQILLKMLEGKFEDKDKAEALAKKGGDYFGKKVDKSLKEWLRQKRK